VYAEHDGSVAAPTAGLHFTPELLERVKRRGTGLAALDLQIGPGTFKPVEVDDLADHPMHAECYRVSDETAELINGRRRAGGACGRSGPRWSVRSKPWRRRTAPSAGGR